MFKLISYVELCSNAILNSIDEISLPYCDDVIRININSKNTRQVIQFYLKSQLQQKKQFGCNNIVIGTCSPHHNWRNKENKFREKYTVTDKTVQIDTQKLYLFLENCWKSLKKDQKDFIFIYENNIDFIDLSFMIKQIIGSRCIEETNREFILRDGNNIYQHFDKVPSYLLSQVESRLRQFGLVL